MQNDKIEAALLQAYHGKARFFGKHYNPGRNRRQGKNKNKKKTKCAMDSLKKKATGINLQELSRAVEVRALWPSLTGRVTRSWS